MWSCSVLRGVLAVPMLGLALSAQAGALEMRVFVLHHREVRDVAAVVEPMLSPEGSILLQPRQNSLTVRDNLEVLKRVAATIARWDAQAGTYRVRVSLLLALESGPAFNQRDPLLRQISSGLTKLFGFRSCAEIDTLYFTADDGNSVESSAGGGRYWVHFVLNASPEDQNRIQLTGFEVSRREPGGVVQEIKPLLDIARINLRLGQTSVVGLSRAERAPQALVVVLVAEPSGGQ
jgi:hypothetical protein